jgi:hypothetical protein
MNGHGNALAARLRPEEPMTKRHVLTAAALLIAYSAAPLFGLAKAEPAYICCGTPADCPGSDKCCAPDAVGMPDCDPERPGYCLATCVRINNEE